jgi:hypothetical protein
MSEQQPHVEVFSRNRVSRSRISFIAVAIPVVAISGFAVYALLPFIVIIGYGLLALAAIGALYLVAIALIDVRRRWIHAHVVHLGEHGVVDAIGWRMLPLALPAPHVTVSEAKETEEDRKKLEQTIRDLAAGGRGYRDIAKDLGISFYRVQKVMAE